MALQEHDVGDVDLDDTSRCPRADACELCHGVDGLDVGTVLTPLGVCCMTICEPCTRQPLPNLTSWRDAADRVYEHAVHLGIDLDQTYEVLEAEQRYRRDT